MELLNNDFMSGSSYRMVHSDLFRDEFILDEVCCLDAPVFIASGGARKFVGMFYEVVSFCNLSNERYS